MIISHVRYFDENAQFHYGYVRVSGGRITETVPSNSGVPSYPIPEGEKVLNGKENWLLPGFIDIHFHGCVGADASDASLDALDKIAWEEAQKGVLTICPATMTMPVPQIEKILAVTADFYERQKREADGRAKLVGLNMEGPFISIEKKGAQDAHNIIPRDSRLLQKWQKISHGLIRYIGIAPEMAAEESVDHFVKEAVDMGIHVALAHTNADYDTAIHAFACGADHAVHLYNAMPPFHHRKPGVVGAVADTEHVRAEMICDGVHIHPAVVRTTFKMLGADRIIFISDSMRAAGMPDGQYTLGGQKVTVHGKYARLCLDQSLAGSVTMLPDCVRTAVREMHIPLAEAVRCATINPARDLQLFEDRGSVTVGKRADLVLWDSELRLQQVILDGEILK